jgi:hypothetical protein
MSENFPDYSMHSSYWAHNQPGWKPCCARCNKRKVDCKKYNSNDLGMFAGEWVCTSCLKDANYKTPAQLVLDK